LVQELKCSESAENLFAAAPEPNYRMRGLDLTRSSVPKPRSGGAFLMGPLMARREVASREPRKSSAVGGLESRLPCSAFSRRECAGLPVHSSFRSRLFSCRRGWTRQVAGVIKVTLICDSCGVAIADGISANAVRFESQGLYCRRDGKDRCLKCEALKHDPEKWVPVFRKDHAQTKS
jgi:hypothetical protein